MWPFLGALATGGMGLLGSMFSSNQSAENTQMQIAASGMQQDKQNAFSERMANTAYQRSAQDMQAAGLNPIAMFSSGSGAPASSPQGSSIQAPMPQNTHPLGNLGKIAGEMVSSAVQAKTMDKMSDEMANLKVENSRLAAATELTKASTATELERKKAVAAGTEETWADINQKRRDVPRQEWDAIKYLDLSSVSDAIRKGANIGSWGAGKLGDVIAPLANTATSVGRLLPRRSTSQRSHVDSKGNSFDEFYENRTGLYR